jgi:hypothetical protein
MKRITTNGLLILVLLGSLGLQAAPDRNRVPSRPGFRAVIPIQVRLDHRDRQLIREIEKNRFKIERLLRENRRLTQKLRYVSPRKARHTIRAIERNERRIERLDRENRYLMKRIRRY